MLFFEWHSETFHHKTLNMCWNTENVLIQRALLVTFCERGIFHIVIVTGLKSQDLKGPSY
jgi:hypothetical protein